MIVVIQCAGTKHANAGTLATTEGIPVDFVADPRGAPSFSGRISAHPDEASGDGRSWRQILLNYNAESDDNPWGLLPAYRLYKPKIYQELVHAVGLDNVFILSAGWGLVRADFLLPKYDITFSKAPKLPSFKRRHKLTHFEDFQQLHDTNREIAFLGGKDYLPLFCSLTETLPVKKTVFYDSAVAPKANGCELQRFPTRKHRNWHYECAKRLIVGSLKT